METISYRTDKNIPLEKLLELYRSSNYNDWWTERNAKAWIDHSYLFVTAWKGDKAVGTATVISDGVNYAHIDDVLVHPGFRRRGIASEMMKIILAAIEPLKLDFVQLIALPGRSSFYKRFGFEELPGSKAMRLR